MRSVDLCIVFTALAFGIFDIVVLCAVLSTYAMEVSVIQVNIIIVFLVFSFACHFDFLESRLCDICVLTTKVYERSMGLSLPGTAQLHEKFPVSGN